MTILDANVDGRSTVELITKCGAASGKAFPITRRTLLASVGASAIFGLPELTSSAWAQSSDVLQDWLRANAIAVRTVDALDEDFSDLEPLANFIADARVVQLGEPSHGAGTSFAAKVRLIKFLHRRKGFDVLVWESGFYDLERTEAGLRAGEDAVASAQRGILKIWSASEQCRPLFEHAQKSHTSTRPLIMAGFDMQFTSGGAFADFSAELRSFVGTLRNPALRRDAIQAAADALEAFGGLNAYVEALAGRAAELSRVGTSGGAMAEALAAWQREAGAKLRPRRDALERLQQAVDRLTKLFDSHPAAFAEIGGERRRGFMARAVVNLGGYGANVYEEYSVEGPGRSDAELVRENRRDALNAQNLRWLIEKGYPGRKIIVWAHNVHVMNAYYGSDWRSVSLDPVPHAMKPSGVFLAEWLGKDVYTIGFSAYEGEDGWVGNPATAIPPARDGGIEARLHRLGLAYAFLDLRAAHGVAHHPLRRPQTLRIPKYDEVDIADATQPYGAIFYIARMEPATLIR
jgi:erythromycin esterase